MVPERAASMLKPKPDEVENLGGSTRVNGELPAVRRRLRIPMRLRVGERPAGADKGEDFEIVVLSFGAGERAGRMGRRGEVTLGVGLRAEEKSLGEGGALVRKKLVGLRSVSLLVPSGALERFGERKMTGSIFSASSSKVVALRLVGEERGLGNAKGHVRFMLKKKQILCSETAMEE